MLRKKWEIKNKINQQTAKTYPDMDQVLKQLLFNREIKSKEEINDFLFADYSKNAHDPFLFRDMEASIDLLIKHIKNQSVIFIYGDYDADGVTSTALLYNLLSILKAQLKYYIPDRVSEGYGLNMEAIDYMIKEGVCLVVTVDNGIRNKNEVEYLKKNGVDVIITDHHQAPNTKDEYPDCLTINPAIPEETYPFKYLSGVGVALKFASALISKTKLDKSSKNILLDSLFEFSAIGTVADCVSLLGENRLIVKKGLELLSVSRKPGIVKLVEISNIKNADKLDAWNIGFQLAPRINAAGRMDHANTAFKLLISKNEDEASDLAKKLNHYNQMRQVSSEEIFLEVEKQLDAKDFLLSAFYNDSSVINEPWNEGIVGLVAGRITEKYYKPCMVITKTEEGYKGSGRSIPEFNIAKALEKNSDYLEKFGGHPLACGFSLNENNLSMFLEQMERCARDELSGKDLCPKIDIDMELSFSQINIELIFKIKKLEPFGQCNPKPIFVSKNAVILDKISMGIEGQHLKLVLKQGNSSLIRAIGFGQTEKWKDIKSGDNIDIVYHLDINEFNGKKESQLLILDILKNAS